jgi:molybdopterin molybdotransferase
VLTCFYEYVLPALKIAMNHPQPFPTELLLPLKGTYRKKPSMTHFLKAKTDLMSVEILPGQESYLLSSFAEANCLMVLDESTEFIQNNHLVKVHLII